MENPDTSSTKNTNKEPLTILKPEHSTLLSLTVILILVIGAASTFGIYYKEHANAATVAHQNSLLNTQITTLNNEIKQQDNINNGIISMGSTYKDPVGQIGLVNGAITMTLPKGWVRLPQSDCTGGTIGSSAVCQDVAAVAPSSLVNSDGTVEWSATIGVFDYSSSDGSARSWYENKYDGSPLISYGTPEAINISESPVNGYSALVFQSASPPLNDPDYTDAYYTVVHGKYAIVVSAQVQVGATYGAANAFDYRTTYQPQINQMVQSIKFQD